MGVNVATFVDGAGRRGELAAVATASDATVAASDDVYATIGVGRIDPDSTEDQVLMTDFSLGAHCCVHIQLLDLVENTWRAVDVGTYDGEPFRDFPTDIDGDGVVDIVHYDDRFAYAFGCYACSWMPPRIFNVRKGKVIDVSAEPRYRKLFEVDYAKAKAECEKPQFDGAYTSGYCAGMVADGVRLGLGDEAWTIALKTVKDNAAEWPEGCRITPTKGACPKDQTLRFANYESGLRWFLVHNGY